MQSKKDLHVELKKKLDLPESYGENLDALWDCLTAWIDTPVEIEWLSYDMVDDSVRSYSQKVIELFNKADGINIVIRKAKSE